MSRFAIRYPYLIIVICLIICVVGVNSLVRMPVDMIDPHSGETFTPVKITDAAGYRVAARWGPGTPVRRGQARSAIFGAWLQSGPLALQPACC